MTESIVTGIPELDEYHAAMQQIEELQAHAAELRMRAITRAAGMVRTIMDSAGLTPGDLEKLEKRRGVSERGPLVARYRDPDSGRTWSGFGREPNWIKGRNRDEFRIQ
jgi:DNA-binding protein H-NS